MAEGETMNRRTFHKLASAAAMAAMAAEAETTEIVIEDRELQAAFDKRSGALTRLVRKRSNWVVQRRPEMGVSFRLLAPLPRQRANFVLGQKQTADSVEKISANEVRIVWNNPVSEHGGVIPLTLTATATLANGALAFNATLENRSALTIETVDYPYFGDFSPPDRVTPMYAEHLWVGALQGEEIYPRFQNGKGYWGVLYPTKTIGSNVSQFCLISAANQGFYVGMHDPDIRYLLEFTFEQHPGVVDWVTNRVPRRDEIPGLPVHLAFRMCHFVFAHPGSRVEFAPVVLHPYDGDWHAGLDVYRRWRATWFGKPKTPAWALDVHSWLQLQIDGAEQDYRVPYRELVKYGEECARNGVAAIQLVGWNRGGQDGGDPSLDTDPALGSWQELHEAIAKIQSLGVKMILFGKPIFADMSTDYYKKELYKYEAVDMWGNKYESNGYSYTTPTQLAGINNRRRAIMDVCSQEYRDIAAREFEKIPALGAAGWLFDEVMQHNGVIYNFGPNHGYRPPGYLFSGDIPLAKQFRAAADERNRDFLFSGEGPGDWLMPYYTLGYYRIGPDTRHALRYLDPQAPLMAAVRGFNARDEINLALAYRYIISYEPYNFKGHVTDFPLTLAYGKQVDALRRRYREYLWDAEFRDTMGATVAADGNHRFTVFRARSGKRAVVAINLEQDRVIGARVSLPDAGTLSIVSPERPDAAPVAGVVEVPARSAVVLLEL
jgi:hypothetical protein